MEQPTPSPTEIQQRNTLVLKYIQEHPPRSVQEGDMVIALKGPHAGKGFLVAEVSNQEIAALENPDKTERTMLDASDVCRYSDYDAAIRAIMDELRQSSRTFQSVPQKPDWSEHIYKDSPL